MAAAARRIGNDPATLLARVSRVRHEIYPGVFRGAAATLADGAGNDYDRVVLLHDLLAAARPDLKTRYAFCTLSPQQADVVVAAARTAYVAPKIAAAADGLAAKAKTPQGRQGFVRLAAFWRAAAAQEREQATQLAADFQKAGARLSAPDPAGLRSIATDHVWLQMQSDAKWIDLDPSLPHATPGQSDCAPTKTGDALPDAAFDTITAVLRLETRDGAQPHDATVASGAWRTEDLARTNLLFAFAEPSGLRPAAPQPPGMRAYTPLLIAGPLTTAAPVITVPAPAKGPGLKAAAGAGASAAAAFGDTPPPAPVAPPTPSGPIPVALRLDMAVTAPTIPRVVVERPIFDRISATDRAAGRVATAPLRAVSLFPFGTVWDIAVNLGTGVVGAGDGSRIDPASNDPADLVRALGAMHRAYYTMRRAVFADALAPAAPPLLSDRPGISFLGLAPQAAGINPFGLAIDRAVEGALPLGDANASVAWGAASVYGERLSVGASTMLRSSDKLDTLPFDDAIEMFYIARHSNTPLSIVRSSADLAALRISDDAKVRLSANLTGGASVVVPSGTVGYGASADAGWWILQPNGRVTDEMQSGMHQDLGEEGVEIKEDTEEAITFRRHGALVKCAGLVMAALMRISAATGGEGAMELVEQAQEQTMAIYEMDEAEEMIEAANQCGG